MSETTTDENPERRAVRELRDAFERVQRRNAELEHLPAEVDNLKRQLGLAWAGVDPDSFLGQTVAAAAAADGVSDPERVTALVHSVRAELTNGGARRQEEE